MRPPFLGVRFHISPSGFLFQGLKNSGGSNDRKKERNRQAKVQVDVPDACSKPTVVRASESSETARRTPGEPADEGRETSRGARSVRGLTKVRIISVIKGTGPHFGTEPAR